MPGPRPNHRHPCKESGFPTLSDRHGRDTQSEFPHSGALVALLFSLPSAADRASLEDVGGYEAVGLKDAGAFKDGGVWEGSEAGDFRKAHAGVVKDA